MCRTTTIRLSILFSASPANKFFREQRPLVVAFFRGPRFSQFISPTVFRRPQEI